jgi:hypothetical protein
MLSACKFKSCSVETLNRFLRTQNGEKLEEWNKTGAIGQEAAISTRPKIRLTIHDFLKKYFNQEHFPEPFRFRNDLSVIIYEANRLYSLFPTLPA